MPATQNSPELQTDMRLLNARGVLDPHRHYKRASSTQLLPIFSEVGRVIEGPTEYYSARLLNKEWKHSLVNQILADDNSISRFRNKYSEIQASTSSGRRAYHKKLKAKRSRDAHRF